MAVLSNAQGKLPAALLAVLFASTALNYVNRLALPVIFPDLRRDLGLTSADYGAVTMAFLLAYAAGQILSGVLIDRIGTKRGFVAGVALWSAAALAHAATAGMATLTAVRILLGLGDAATWPAGVKAVAERFEPRHRAFATAVFDAGSALGAVAAPALVASLALRYGWRAAFAILGAAGVVWIVAWVLVHANAGPLVPVAAAESGWFLQAVRSRYVWGLALTRMLASPVWWFYVFWLPDYLVNKHGFTLGDIALFGWIPYLVVVAGKIAGGAWSDFLLRRGVESTQARKTVMLTAAAIMSAGLLVNLAGNAAEALLWVSTATFGFGMWSPNIYALHADIFSTPMIARAIGITGMAASLGGAFFSWLTGNVVEHFGYVPAFWIAGTSGPVAGLVLFALVPRGAPAGRATADAR